MKKYFHLCFLLLITSCEQINKSIKETEHPVSKNVNKDKSVTLGNGSSSSSVEIFHSNTAHLQTISENGTVSNSEILRIIQAQMKSAGVKDSATILNKIREQLTKMPLRENNLKNNFIADDVRLNQIQAELKNLPQFKGKKLMLYNGIYLYKSGNKWVINIRIQNPDIPENVDSYSYKDGAWQMPTPEREPRLDGDVSYLCSLDKVSFSAAKKVYETAAEKLKEIEGAEAVSSIHFSYNYYKKENAEWYTNIRGARNDYRLKFDINGNFVEMKK
jgi:hypothetical protein